eukprot:scaffold71472_cov50-Phaeocystis_antarctica.AAC.1
MPTVTASIGRRGAGGGAWADLGWSQLEAGSPSSSDHESSQPPSSAQPPPTGPASSDCAPLATGAASHPAAGSVVASHWASSTAAAPASCRRVGPHRRAQQADAGSRAARPGSRCTVAAPAVKSAAMHAIVHSDRQDCAAPDRAVRRARRGG